MSDAIILDAEKLEDLALGRSSSPQSPHSGQILTRTFHLTVSTRDPVTNECQFAIVQYARTQCVYSYVVAETGKSGKLHIHAILVFKEHREKKKLQENITNRIVRKNGHPEAKNGLAVKIQVCPGHKWYDEYLNKEEGRVVLYDGYKRDKVTEYFPSEELQEYLQTHTRASGPVDKHMAEHERRWIEFNPDDDTYFGALQYLRHRMYVQRDMIVYTDERRLRQIAMALHEYRTKSTKYTLGDAKYLINLRSEEVFKAQKATHVSKKIKV